MERKSKSCSESLSSGWGYFHINNTIQLCIGLVCLHSCDWKGITENKKNQRILHGHYSEIYGWNVAINPRTAGRTHRVDKWRQLEET